MEADSILVAVLMAGVLASRVVRSEFSSKRCAAEEVESHEA